MTAEQFDLTGDEWQMDQGSDWTLAIYLEDVTQTIRLIGSPASGTFVLGYAGGEGSSRTTAAIAYNAAAATVQTELEKIIGYGKVTVTGSAGGPWVVTIDGRIRLELGDPLITADATGLVAAGGGVSVSRTVFDLTGYTARMKIKNEIEGTLIASYTTSDVMSIDTTYGILTINVPAATTQAYTVEEAVYDIEIVSPTSNVYSLFYGAIGLRLEVTDA